MPLDRLQRELFRAFLREARVLDAAGPLLLFPPLTLEAVAKRYGRGSYCDPHIDARELQRVAFPGLDDVFVSAGLSETPVLTGADLRVLVRQGFRSGKREGSDAGFRALAALNRLRSTSGCHTVTTTREGDAAVSVFCSTTFIGWAHERVLRQAAHYPFAYRVRIRNEGTTAVQVMGRHWVFVDEVGGTVEVPRHSPGLVGLTPTLRPGEAFEYVSGTQLATPGGVMRGALHLLVRDPAKPGEQLLDAQVAQTRLQAPPGVADAHTSAASAKPKETAGGEMR